MGDIEVIRLLYYLPMEIMIESRDIKHMACVERIRQLEEENKKLKEDVDYFRQCYLDLKKLCEKEGFMLSDEEVTKMFNLDKIK